MDENLSEGVLQSSVLPSSQPKQSFLKKLLRLRRKSYFTVLLVVIIAFLIGNLSFENKPRSLSSYPSATIMPQATLQVRRPPLPTPTLALPLGTTQMSSISVTGTIKKLSNLLLIKPDTGTAAVTVKNGETYDHYYSAGTITSGPYSGYKRIIAYLGSLGVNGSVPMYLLGTKDDKTYILDLSNQVQTLKKYPSQLQYMASDLDPAKVTKIDNIGLAMPLTIPVGGKFVLSYDNLSPRITKEINSVGEYGEVGMYGDAKIATPLNYLATINGMTAYESLTQPASDAILKDYKDADKQSIRLKDSFLRSTTQVFIADATGLLYKYNLSTQDNIDTYFQQVDSFNKAQSLYDQDQRNPFPPKIDFADNLGFKATTASFDGSHYNSYNIGLPPGCGGTVNSPVLKNVNDSDLQKIGSVYGVDMYRLADNNHPLYSLEEDTKAFFDYTKNIRVAPPLASYVSKNPLLIIKDPWNRMVLLGEWDNDTPGGCGKPVIYLYPEKPTDVTVSFLAPMAFTTDIPHYQNKWNVRAEPNGILTDLQPQFTNCETLPNDFGAEYARGACRTNQYPYLYWSGTVTSGGYPLMSQGWIVTRNDLSTVLSKKLHEMGMTEKESHDMLSYWVPELLTKQGTYYRISFIETPQLNEMIPMSISPRPDNLFRVFLDWSVFDKKPNNTIQPETLEKIVRKGFTVVEWGGLKQ